MFRKMFAMAMTLCALTPVFSQTNFQPGYVITAGKDTLKGWIDFRKWENNPEKIAFKSSEQAQEVWYGPLGILEFKVENEIYVSAIIKNETSPRSTDQLEEDASMHFKTDTAFLQALYRSGSKGLFFYKNPDGKENFYTASSGQFELLLHKMYLQSQDGKLYNRENKQYINQLVLYLNECPSLQSKIYSSGYQLNSLQKLFAAYDACINKDAAYQKKEEKLKLEIGVLVGLTLTNINFQSAEFDYLTQTNYQTSANVTPAVSFDVVFPRRQGKWSINNELMYAGYKFTGTYVEVTSPDQTRTTETEIAYGYLKMNNMLRFKYPIGNAFMFFNAGVSTGVAVAKTNEKTVTAKFYDQVNITHEPAIPGTTSGEVGFLFGFGARWNHFSFEGRGEWGNGMSDITSLKSSTTRLHFLLGYRF